MDRIFLETMAKCYINDSDFGELDIKDDQVVKYLVNSYTKFKNRFPFIHDEILNYSPSHKQTIIYNFLDQKYASEEIMLEVFSDVIANISNIVGSTVTNNLSRLRARFLGATNNNEDIAFLDSVIQANYNNCNRTCTPVGVRLSDRLYSRLIMADPDNNRTLDDIYSLIKYQTRNNPNSSPSVVQVYKISKCLRLCNIDYLTSIYAEGIITYENCISRFSGDNFSVSTYADIFKGQPFGVECNDIFNYLTEIFQTLNRLIDITYARDSIRKQRWLEVINEKIKAYKAGRNYYVDFEKVDDSYEHPESQTIGR